MTNTSGLNRLASSKLLKLFALAAITVAISGCRRAEFSHDEVMQAVRDYNREHSPSVVHASNASTPATPGDLESYEVYDARIAQLFEQGDFDQLDKEGRKIRAEKARVRGGGWKLNEYYVPLCHPGSSPSELTDTDWKTHLNKIRDWKGKSPRSASARVALACSYLGWAWMARGNGSADTVTDVGWALFNQRIKMAENSLVEAVTLEEECPLWYYVMQGVAQAEGWSRQDETVLFERATSFEPGFYYYYQNHIEFLLPKWYGLEGEAQDFLNQATTNLPEPDGSILYFELTKPLACGCGKVEDSLDGISWPRVNEGYANLERIYGVTNLKNNRYAYLAYAAGDKSAAAHAFTLIGDSPDPNIWRGQEAFDGARAWALGN